MTIAEAEAWEAGRDACVATLRDMAARMRASICSRVDETAMIVRSNAATLDLAADRCAALQPRAVVTGLDGRGA